jgi:hypothetical protein
MKTYVINRAEIDLAEFHHYQNVNDFLQRKLHPDSFFIDKAVGSFVAPCQGILDDSKDLFKKNELKINEIFIFYNKESDYNLKMIKVGIGDYHGLHAPCDGIIAHFKNEDRYNVFVIDTDYGIVSMVLRGSILLKGVEPKRVVQRGDLLGIIEFKAELFLILPLTLKCFLYQGPIQVGTRLGLFERD